MKAVLKSVSIKGSRYLLTKIYRSIKLTLIGFLSLLAYTLYLVGCSINFIKEKLRDE